MVIQACATGTGSSGPDGSAGITTPGAATSAAAPTRSPAAGSPGTADGLCSLFTVEELSAFAGVPLDPGQVTGPLDTVCNWLGDGEGYALVQWIDDVDYWSTPDLAPGFTPLEGIGVEAFVLPERDDEWAAQALLEDGIAAVGIRGPAVNQEAAVALLETFLARH
jgi:hypothetical protein